MEYRFQNSDVYIRRASDTGDLMLLKRPQSWDGFLALAAETDVPPDFLSKSDRAQGKQARDPFEGWHE